MVCVQIVLGKLWLITVICRMINMFLEPFPDNKFSLIRLYFHIFTLFLYMFLFYSWYGQQSNLRFTSLCIGYIL
jgi:hypothetical protein